jgi:hypothetical protein
MDRNSLLCDLVEFRRPLNEILPDLKGIPWDSEFPLVMLEQQHLASVLRRYRNNELGSGDVEVWANAIEGRDDISSEQGSAAGRLLHELANPHLTKRLTLERAAELLESISWR